MQQRVVMNVVRGRDIVGASGKKTAWDRVGVLVIDGDKYAIRLDSIPAGAWDGWLRAFPKDEERPMARAAAAARPAVVEDEDVPF